LTETAVGDERLRQAAQVNPEDKFSLVFTDILEALMLERMDQNEAIVGRYMGDQEFQRQVAIRLAKDAYRRLGGLGAGHPTYPPPARRR
jgi:type I restriction enzyme R subunit